MLSTVVSEKNRSMPVIKHILVLGVEVVRERGKLIDRLSSLISLVLLPHGCLFVLLAVACGVGRFIVLWICMEFDWDFAVGPQI